MEEVPVATMSRRFRFGPLRGAARRDRRPLWLQDLLKRGRDVLPSYTPQRAGWLIAGRRTMLLLFVMATAMFYGVAAAILPPTILVIFAAPYALLGLLVIWALPDSRAVPIKLLLQLYLLYFAVQLLWPTYLALNVGGLPWIALRRLVGTLVTLVFLICLSISGTFRGQVGDILKKTRPASTIFIIFFVAQAIASIFSVAPSETIGRWIGAVLVNVPMFFLTLWIFGTRTRSFDWWLKWFLIFMAILMAIGAVEYRLKHVIWANSIPSFLQVDQEMLVTILTPNFRGGYRVLTTFTGPLSWGELTALATPFALHRLFNAKTNVALLGWLAFDAAVVLSGYVSGARLAVVGAIVAHTVYVLMWALRRWRTHPGSLIGISATMLYPAMMIVMAGAILFVPAVHHRVLGGGQTQSSNEARQEQLRLAIPAVAKRPLFGYGPGQGGGAVGWRNEAGFLSIDSGFLSTAADFGLIGFFSYFGGVVVLAWGLAKRGLRSQVAGMPLELAMVALFATFLSCRMVLSQGDNDMLYLMFFGMGIALLYLDRVKAAAPAPAE